MPELPEVEYIARQLRTELVGRTIVGARVEWPRTVAPLDPEDFRARAVGERVTGIGRRGKHLLIALGSGDTLLVHRRMSGNLVFARPGEAVAYTRACFDLDDGRRLIFSDPRKFGRIGVTGPEELRVALAALGPEPLDDTFTAEELAARLAGQGRAIKAVLLDQRRVAGLGNIYADEALFRAGIHPTRPAAGLTTAEIAALRAAIQTVLLTGIEHGGTTFGRHRDVFDEAGTNVDHLLVYRRTGQPCVRCGTPIQRLVVAQRGTHFCPRCQPLLS
jgi:formamidopyrimidine-DNA glycosylase